MNLIFPVFYGLFGAAAGSFLNVCILRIPEGRSFITGRSRCPACGHVLTYGDMIPVLSWILLRGRCRYCGSPISRQYPAVELLTSCMFILCCIARGPGPDAVLMCLLGCLLITAAFIDGRYMYIPDTIHLLILLLALLSLAAGLGPSLPDRAAGALFGGGFLALLNLLSRGGVGWGDIKLFTVCGLLMGTAPNITAILTGYVLAGLWCAFPLIRGTIGRRTAVPMAPYFAVSLMVCGLWYHELALWYMGLF